MNNPGACTAAESELVVLSEASPLDGVELVMFDLDGTLIDSAPSLAQAVDTMLTQLNRPEAGLDKVRQWIGNGAPMLVKRALSDSREVDPSLPERLQQHAFDLFMSAYSGCSDGAEHAAQLYPGVLECLRELQRRSVAMALVTNKPAQFLPSILQTLELDGFFGQVIGGDTLAQKKPHPLPLQHCLQHVGVTADKALMVGDSAADVGAARAAGVKVVAVSYGYSFPQPVAASQPDWLVDCVTELL
ncbi:MAG: phosphoglycolate phosphatase [Motiliproteus sp.]